MMINISFIHESWTVHKYDKQSEAIWYFIIEWKFQLWAYTSWYTIVHRRTALCSVVKCQIINLEILENDVSELLWVLINL